MSTASWFFPLNLLDESYLHDLLACSRFSLRRCCSRRSWLSLLSRAFFMNCSRALGYRSRAPYSHSGVVALGVLRCRCRPCTSWTPRPPRPRSTVSRGCRPWLSPVACRPWLSPVAVARGCRPWLSLVAVARGCRPWLSPLALARGSRFACSSLALLLRFRSFRAPVHLCFALLLRSVVARVLCCPAVVNAVHTAVV